MPEASSRLGVPGQHLGGEGDEVPEDQSSPAAPPLVPPFPPQSREAPEALSQGLFLRRFGVFALKILGELHQVLAGVPPRHQALSEEVLQGFFHVSRPRKVVQDVEEGHQKGPALLVLRRKALLKLGKGIPQSGGVFFQQSFHAGEQTSLPQVPTFFGAGIHEAPQILQDLGVAPVPEEFRGPP